MQESTPPHSHQPLRPEQALLLFLARGEISAGDRARVRALLEAGVLDWEEFTRQTRRHRLGPLVHHHVQAFCSDLVPPGVQAPLRTLFHRRLRRSLVLSRALPELLDLLEERGVRALPFKGPVLAARAYPSEALRTFGDLDLLVCRGDARRAAAALTGAGFERLEGRGSPRPPQHTGRGARSLSWLDPYSNAATYVRGRGTPRQVAVDLHWELASRHFPFPMRPEEVLERSVPVRLEGGREVAAFSPEDALLFSCAHATKHRWRHLAFVCDVAALVRSAPSMNWGWVLREARALRSERMVLVGLHLAEVLLGAPLPPPVREEIGARPRVAALSGTAQRLLFSPDRERSDMRARLRKVVRVSRFHLRVRDRWSDGLGASVHNLQLAMTPHPEDRAWADLPAGLSFLYVLVRPLRLLSQSLFGQASA